MNLLTGARMWNLRTKFTLPISVLLVASIVIISSYLIRRQAAGFRQVLETKGETIVRIMSMQAESGVLFEDRKELDDLLAKLSTIEDVRAAMIFSKDDRLLSSIGSWDNDALTGSRPIPQPSDSGDQICDDFYVTDAEGHEYIVFNSPVCSRVEQLDRENLGLTSGIDAGLARQSRTDVIGSARLVLDLESVQKLTADAVAAAVILALIVAVLTILLLTSVVRFITKPMQLLVRVTDQVSRGDLTQRVNVDQQDEIGQLAKTFNKMIESLKLSRDEIEMYNRTLEERIIQATLKLEEAQAQLVQSEKMSAIGQLAAGVAHELNNPLGGILGYAQFTLEKMKRAAGEHEPSKEAASYIRYLSDIEAQARRCKAIVQNLLRFSRSSKSTDFEPVAINAVVQDTITFVEHQLHMNQIGLEVNLDPQTPQIQGNSGQLQQVFTNLIITAMHASPPESTITVRTRFSPAVGEFGGAVEVSVHDHGTGIAPENLKKIFEPFFTTKEVGKGTGLGLSVSYGIVREHGGEIRVESEEGKQTTFTVILPVQKRSGTTDNTVDQVSIGLTGSQQW